MKNKLVLILLLIIAGCVPPAVEVSSNNTEIEIYGDLEDCEPCPLLLNFASSNYQNHDWRSAVDNYNQLLKCNCGKIDPENTYKYMAYSYQQLNILDSAAYIFKQGLKYTPEDIDLLKMAGINAGRMQLYEDQIYYFDKILSIDENNLEILELLSNVYRDQDMYEEQISILNIWLKYDPTNINANSDKRSAYESLGRDISSVDKEIWEAETSNIDFGLEYIRSLEQEENFEKIIEVCNELLIYDKYNIKVLKSLGDAYQTLYKNEDAIKIYKELIKVAPTDYDVAIEISKILVDMESYQEALNWTEKAVKVSNKKAKSLYQRAEVYFEIATSCSSIENELSHWTRAVYEIAWEDYRDALNSGYKQARNRKVWLEEQGLITQIGTWFQLEPKTEIKLNESPLECYSWIKRTLQKRKL